MTIQVNGDPMELSEGATILQLLEKLQLSPDGVAVALLHPGWVRTEMTRGSGLIDASEAARGLIARMDELTLERTGSFWHQNGTPLPW